MKDGKYIAIFMAGAIGISLVAYHNGKDYLNTHNDNTITTIDNSDVPTDTNSNPFDNITILQPEDTYVVDTYTNENYGHEEPVVPEVSPQENVPTIDENELHNFVNEDVYGNLVGAKAEFDRLLANGSVSTQMMNHGTNLSSEDCAFIDNAIDNSYQWICQYISAYEAGDVITCYHFGVLLHDYYYNGISREYLYNLLVRKQLPEGYQSNFYYDENGNIYDENHNIRLENGNRVHLVGFDDDTIVGPTIDNADPYTSMWIHSEWYRKLPSIILDQYQVLNAGEEDGTCNVWNVSKVERLTDGAWEQLKQEGSEVYGFDPTTTKIYWYEDMDSDENGDTTEYFVFEDENGEEWGALTEEQANTVGYIYTLQDATITGEGHIDVLEEYARNLRGQQNAYQYTR